MGEAAVFDSTEFEVGRFGSKDLICLFNWQDEAKTLRVPLEETANISDYWTGKCLGKHTGTFEIEVPGHGGRVLKLT